MSLTRPRMPVRAYLKKKKYGLFCSLILERPRSFAASSLFCCLNAPWLGIPGRGGGGKAVLGLIFAGYMPLASQNPYSIIVYSVANYRPHL